MASSALDVRLTLSPSNERPVGRLFLDRRGCFFEYDREFLDDPLWLSPFKLPPEPGLVEHRDREFGPIFGLFDDSLPDGWGLLLMDRLFQRRGMAPGDVTALDRLAYLGTRTLGALTFHPPTESVEARQRTLDLQAMAQEARRVLAGASTDVLPELVRAGGSPGGARPKVLVGIADDAIEDPSADEMLSGEDDLPEGYQHWIVKFPAGTDDPGAGAVENAYAEMARRAGIDMPPTRLFETNSGDRYFGVQRFDRDNSEGNNRRFHMHTFGNLIHADFRVPSCDYRQLLEVTRVLTRNHQDVVECFRRMVFNVASHNRDDHVKNFAFQMDESGEWRLAPAYDLTYSEGPGGEHTMTVAGEGRTPGRRQVMELAESAGLEVREAEAVVEEVLDGVEAWNGCAEQASVGRAARAAVGRAIEQSAFRLG